MEIKKFFRRIEDIFVAITFAESGDRETASRIMEEERLDTQGYNGTGVVGQKSPGLPHDLGMKGGDEITAQPTKP